MAKLQLSSQKINECRRLASEIVSQTMTMINAHTSVGVERAALRLVGVTGAINKSGQSYPIVNEIIDQLKEDRVLAQGALFWYANALIAYNGDAATLIEGICDGSIRLSKVPQADKKEIRKLATDLCKAGLKRIVEKKNERDALRKKQGDPYDPSWQSGPLIYVIVATGNIFEDVLQAKSAARVGADSIAVIRSTAQSLLDYVPEGATTEGFGGTYATQENFRIMRAALDEVGDELGRYIRLTNYSSGLCMSEIAAIASLERLDFLLNDAMYGILFRDINMKRTLIDQHFSRLILSLSDIFIQTGEDNYLTTADAIENGHQVLASQFINERFALTAHMKEEQMCLGHAAEMDPWHPNVLLLEIARAQMTRDIFPKSPIKFMPPTRHKVGDIFFSHLMDAMFNLVGSLTNQGVQLLGMPTEAMHTPLLMDRWMSIKGAKYVFGATKDLYREIHFKNDGIISKWAQKVLDDTLETLRSIEKMGLFTAIEKKTFANVSRREDGGKGYDGVLLKHNEYLNPFFDLL